MFLIFSKYSTFRISCRVLLFLLRVTLLRFSAMPGSCSSVTLEFPSHCFPKLYPLLPVFSVIIFLGLLPLFLLKYVLRSFLVNGYHLGFIK